MSAVLAAFFRMLSVATAHAFVDDGYFGVTEVCAAMDFEEAADALDP